LRRSWARMRPRAPYFPYTTLFRSDRADVFSHGFICPKGSTLKHLHEDPDWLRRPRVRRGGRLVEVDWAEAFAEVERRLPPIVEQHGRDAVAVYIGNPTAHSLGALLRSEEHTSELQ